MAKTYLFLAALLILGPSSAAIGAAPAGKATAPEADAQVLLDSIRGNRKAVIGASLNLSADESAKFWPLYDRYQQEVTAVGDRMLAIVQDYSEHFSDLSNEKALQLMNDYLAAEADRLKVRQSYVAEFAKVLPGRAVARFYQIENKMDAILRYDLAATIPVVEDPKKGSTN